MDKKLYIIYNSGSIDRIFDNEEERDRVYAELCEREKHYQVTHYYYYKGEMALGEYVCEKLCRWWTLNFDNTKVVAQRDGKDHEELFYSAMRLSCMDCPFKKYSKYGETCDKSKETCDKNENPCLTQVSCNKCFEEHGGCRSEVEE